jgi:uncharacterized membrane protein/uncharacterized membrane protein YeaQ/YmgE (transglycosylase-associated protein family)
MELILWLVTGALAGLIATSLVRDRSYGAFGNIIIGLLGSLGGGWLMQLLGGALGNAWWQRLIVSALGAIVLLAVARWIRSRIRHRALASELPPAVDLETQISRLSPLERRVVERILQRPRPRDPNETFDEQLTFGERLADQVAAFGGSWTFIGLFLLFMLVWMIVNSQASKPFDAFPFILLNLMLSCLAALQAPVIMMSQNRQSAKDRSDAKLDYDVNLRADGNIARVLETVEQRDATIQELLAINRRQLTLLEKLAPAAAGPG